MLRCPRCHAHYEDAPAFCGQCGAPITCSEQREEAESDPLVGRVVGQRYRILDLVGRGGMGAVYRAEHVKMGKVMAVKVLSEELSRDRDLARRFEREAETVSRLTAINTVQVFDFGADAGMMYLVMEYLDGKDLSALLAAEGAFPFERAARIMVQVADAIAEAHSKGIIHRDLKPANILVVRQGSDSDFVKVLDFGLATLKNIHRTKITRQGSLVGTPYYMSPEHIRGDAVDERSDIYALGAVLFKLLTNETPFQAATAMGIISKHLTEPTPRPSETAPGLAIPAVADAICMKAMAKEPAERYESALALKQALRQAIGIDHSETTIDVSKPAHIPAKPANTVFIGARQVPVGTRSDFVKLEKRRWRYWIGGGVLTLLLLGAGAMLLLRSGASVDLSTETEPNDRAGDADPIAPGVPLRGTIRSADDIDWFLVRGPAGPFAVAAEVSAVPGVDLALQLVDPVLSNTIASADAGGVGEPEILYATRASTSPVYLLVRSQGGFSNEHAYELSLQLYSATGLEAEPNNSANEATLVSPGRIIGGQLEVGDTDWFTVPAGAASVQVSSAAGLDVKLTLGHPGSGRTETIDEFGPGQGERASAAAHGAPLFFSISEAGAYRARSTRTYQIDVR